MKKIIQYQNPTAVKISKVKASGVSVLRQIAQEIKIKDIKTDKIQKIIREMSESLASQDDGVALAAPQIGYSLKIFVVSGKIFKPEFSEQGLSERDRREKERPASTPERDPAQKYSGVKDMVFINPKISKLSKAKEWVPEGCLSLRWLYGLAERSQKATVTAYDETGKKFTRGASGLLAQIFQHETDHLKGVLFIDHAKDVKDEPPQ